MDTMELLAVPSLSCCSELLEVVRWISLPLFPALLLDSILIFLLPFQLSAAFVTGTTSVPVTFWQTLSILLLFSRCFSDAFILAFCNSYIRRTLCKLSNFFFTWYKASWDVFMFVFRSHDVGTNIFEVNCWGNTSVQNDIFIFGGSKLLSINCRTG